nr:hypothetical protein [Tanacetum cinerariifolium]GFA50294.1 hypothetical protein [Tanacetum cinerariifolium]
MARIQFCDYHNMVAILEKGEHNIDFHPMVDFVEGSPLRYALTFKPTIYVSLIRQFWSIARIKTTKEGTKILATVDGILRTVTESSLRRNLKLQDEEGISYLPDTDLFENLSLMGYNISQNQKFTFQKGQFSHQWKYLIHSIMQCLSPKRKGFNKFSSNIATALVCLAINRTYNFSKMIFDGLVKNINNKVSKFLMYPRFLTMCLRMTQFGQITYTQQYVVPFHTTKFFTTLRVNSPSFSGRTIPLFDTMLIRQGEGSGTPTEPHHTPFLEVQPSSHTHISSPSLPTVTTISTALIPTITPSKTTPLRKYTRRARIAQSSALLPVADEPASPVRDVSQREACPTKSGFIADQDRTIIAKSSTLPHDLATRVTSPAAVEGSMQQTINELTDFCTSLQRQHSELLARFEAQEVEINKFKEIVKLLEDGKEMAAEGSGDDAQSKGGASVLSSGGVQVVPTAVAVALANVSISTGSGVVPTASTTISTTTPIFATATTVTPYTRRKGKEKMVETHTPKKKKRMIAGLDKLNETIAKHLEEYDQAAAEITIGERIELISELVKYQDHHSKILKYQAQQRKSRTKKQKRDFYMVVIRNNLGWKVKDFKGMSFEEVEVNFKTVWVQIEGGVSKILEGEAAWLKRKGIRSKQESAKKQKTTKEVPEEVKSCDEIPEEKIKELIRLVLIEEVYVEALQVKHPIIH